VKLCFTGQFNDFVKQPHYNFYPAAALDTDYVLLLNFGAVRQWLLSNPAPALIVKELCGVG
jgi:hypothetical protein